MTVDGPRQPAAPAAAPARWSDDVFLDSLRHRGDEAADAAVVRLFESHGGAAVNRLFQTVDDTGDVLPNDAPAAFREFWEAHREVPFPVDAERMERGRSAFFDHAAPAALVLLTKSLMEGYAAPCLSRILAMTGNLERHPYRRLLGVLEMLVDVCSEPLENGRVPALAMKLRLLHAGVRRLVPRHLPGYEERFGVPVNLEDMLATIMGFSWLVVEGLRKLEVGLSEEEAEDFWYLWHVFGRLMGIHPPGEPASAAWMPGDLAAAAEFYAAYARRQFAEAEENPEGVELARDNLRMVRDLLPRGFRGLGPGRILPRLYCSELCGETAARVGVERLRGHALLKLLLMKLPGLYLRFWSEIDPCGHAHRDFARLVFEGMIHYDFRDGICFLVPESLADLEELAVRGGACHTS